MNILAVSTWFPYPPDNGSKMRTYHLLRHLGERHQLDLLTLRQSDDDLRYLGEVRQFCGKVNTFREPEFRPSGLGAFISFLSPVPRYFQAHRSPGLEAELQEWVQDERYDAVMAISLGAAPYVAALSTSARKILDEHNIESQVIKRRAREECSVWKRFRYLPTWVKAERYERMLAAQFDAVSVVSEKERDMLRALTRNGHPPAHVIPNGVDPALFAFEGTPKERDLIAFTGALSYGANRDAAECLCREILPIVRRHVPQARVRITGRISDADREAFTSLASSGRESNSSFGRESNSLLGRELNSRPNDAHDPGDAHSAIELTGYVDDIRPVIASASVLVAPLRFGGGTRLKILEAMALGTPVVSTSMGAEGIPAMNGRDILLAETSDDIAVATIRILRDPGLAREISRNARELVRERYQWPAIAVDFERLVSGQVP